MNTLGYSRLSSCFHTHGPRPAKSGSRAPLGAILLLLSPLVLGSSALAQALRWPFVEGDTLHPAANIDKMAVAQLSKIGSGAAAAAPSSS